MRFSSALVIVGTSLVYRGVEILPSVDPIPAVDAFIKAIWANIFIGCNRAFYDTSCDRIHLPDPSQFRIAEQAEPPKALQSDAGTR